MVGCSTPVTDSISNQTAGKQNQNLTQAISSTDLVALLMQAGGLALAASLNPAGTLTVLQSIQIRTIRAFHELHR